MVLPLKLWDDHEDTEDSLHSIYADYYRYQHSYRYKFSERRTIYLSGIVIIDAGSSPSSGGLNNECGLQINSFGRRQMSLRDFDKW